MRSWRAGRWPCDSSGASSTFAAGESPSPMTVCQQCRRDQALHVLLICQVNRQGASLPFFHVPRTRKIEEGVDGAERDSDDAWCIVGPACSHKPRAVIMALCAQHWCEITKVSSRETAISSPNVSLLGRTSRTVRMGMHSQSTSGISLRAGAFKTAFVFLPVGQERRVAPL